MTKFISIDAFGGDKGPKVVLGGINQFLYQNADADVHFRIFGKQSVLRKLLSKFPRVARNSTIIDAPDVIRGTDKIRDVVRHADRAMYENKRSMKRRQTEGTEFEA